MGGLEVSDLGTGEGRGSGVHSVLVLCVFVMCLTASPKGPRYCSGGILPQIIIGIPNINTLRLTI